METLISRSHEKPCLIGMSGEMKLITCILPKRLAASVREKLLNEKGIVTGNINNARGPGHITAEEVVEFIYDHAELHHPHGGIMFQNALRKSTEYVLPEVHSED